MGVALFEGGHLRCGSAPAVPSVEGCPGRERGHVQILETQWLGERCRGKYLSERVCLFVWVSGM